MIAPFLPLVAAGFCTAEFGVSTGLPVYSVVNILFWLSIGLWVIALVSYALILDGNEQQERKENLMSVIIPFGTPSHGAVHSRSLRHLYRILVLSAIGAILTGGLYLLTGI